MKVISTNISEPKEIIWRGKSVRTGIFKSPTSEPLYLGTQDVRKDSVINRKYHGGVDKACYLFSAEAYNHWKYLYPDKEIPYGMFGENLTILGLEESLLHIGDVYRIGTAVVQISIPREPCYKLGVRFGTQEILKQFIAHARPGTYVRVLEEGEVAVNDQMELVKSSDNSLTTKAYFQLLYAKEKNPQILALAASNTDLPKKERLKWESELKALS